MKPGGRVADESRINVERNPPMKTSLLSAAVAALGLVGGCASSGHAPSNQSNASFSSQNSNSNSRKLVSLDFNRNTPLNLSNRATGPQPLGNPLIVGAAVTLANAYGTDASFAEFINESYGLAVFPVISNAGNDNFGTFNRGLVFQNGRLVGESSTKSFPNAGNQAFSQIVFFENQGAFDAFRQSGFDLPEGIPTFPIVDGAADWARYTNGYAVFTTSGTSSDEFAPAGGQSFTFFDFAE